MVKASINEVKLFFVFVFGGLEVSAFSFWFGSTSEDGCSSINNFFF